MSTLHATTIRRLLKLPQSESVWEGDRRSLGEFNLSDADEGSQDCVIWVDGSEGTVRSMEMVSPEAEMEVMVRTLLRGMETPQSHGKPCRPQSIIVRDREIIFFLRGILQELGIKIEYAPELPLIDTLFQELATSSEERPPLLPKNYESALLETAGEIWENAPWDFLDDSEVITVEFSRGESDPLYISVMGMLGQEYGILLYRSLDSLKTFRSQITAGEEDRENLENIFLKQDCWFLNYELPEEAQEEEVDLLAAEDVSPYFGSIHPYEGIRPFLGEDEATVIYIALQGFKRFIEGNEETLETELAPNLKQNYQVPLPKASPNASTTEVTVSKNSELEEELMAYFGEEEEDSFTATIKDDLVPKDSFLSMGMVPWEIVTQMQHNPKQHYESLGLSEKGEGLPIILIQTSRPKAQTMIEQIQDSGGLEGIGFNQGEDESLNAVYDLGLLRMGDGELYLFGEFHQDDPTHAKARENWDRRCQETGGYCALLIARGLKGASRGQPQLRDMMALFEAKALSTEDLGLGVLSAIELPDG